MYAGGECGMRELADMDRTVVLDHDDGFCDLPWLLSTPVELTHRGRDTPVED
jgi:hypothetical protein